MDGNTTLFLIFLMIACLLIVLLVAVLFLLNKYQNFERKLYLVDETFKQWGTNFNEFRGMCDVLERNLGATNLRVDGVVHELDSRGEGHD